MDTIAGEAWGEGNSLRSSITITKKIIISPGQGAGGGGDGDNLFVTVATANYFPAYRGDDDCQDTATGSSF